jgi:hypothetical protein
MNQRPTAGMRLRVEKVGDASDAASYRGFVHLPDADVPADVTIARPGGAVTVKLGDGGSPEMAKTVSALLRAATKGLADGGDLPRKIVRWRG